MKKIYYILIPALLLLIVSCSNDNKEIDYNPNINASVETVWAQLAFTDVFNYVFVATKDTALLNSGYNKINGAEVFYTEDPDPKIHFKFPYFFFNCPDSCNRRGDIYAAFDGPVNSPGVTANITYEEYYFEFIRLNASHQINYEGKNPEQKDSYNNQISNGGLLVMDTIQPWGYSWNCNQQLIWIEGESTPYDHADDLFEITGTSYGTSSAAIDYEIEVSSALSHVFSCKWIPSGIQNIYTPGLLVTSGQIDFRESDSCSNYVWFVFDGNPFYTKLKTVR